MTDQSEGITGQYDIDDTTADDGLDGTTDDATPPSQTVDTIDGDAAESRMLDVFKAPAIATRPLNMAREALHDHVAMMRDAFQLADGICYTSAVPERYRGKPKEAAAAIMYGASIGITDPMVSVQKVINVHGTPGLEARSMKGVLEGKGFRFRVTERTATRFRIEAWAPDSNRRVDPPDEVSEWTIERAQLAEFCPVIDPATGDYKRFNKRSGGTAVQGNMKYITQPTEMLEAKGTAEVCRAIGSGVFMGMPYAVEELRTERWANPDGDADDAPATQAAITHPLPQRGVGALRDRAKKARASKATPAEPAAEPMDADEVPLPADEPAPQPVPDQPPAETSPAPPTADVTPEPEPAAAEVVADVAADPPPAPAPDIKPAPIEVPPATPPAPAPEPTPTPADPSGDDLEMTPAVRSKGVDMMTGLLINSGISDTDRWPAVAELASTREGGTWHPVTGPDDLTNAELKYVVDSMRAWSQKGALTARMEEAGDIAATRAAAQ